MAATFCSRASASRFDSAAAWAPTATSTTSSAAAANFTRLFYFTAAASLLVLRPLGLTRARHKLELPPLHQLLEDAELGLLANVEHLIDGVVRSADVRRAS